MVCFCHSEALHEQQHGSTDRAGDRLFDPETHPGTIETELCNLPFTFLSCPNQKIECPQHGSEGIAHHDSIVISIGGVSYGEQTPDSEAAAAVFVHANSCENLAWVVDVGTFPTKQRAELLACLAALDVILGIKERNPIGPQSQPPLSANPYYEMRRVIIKTDSGFLVHTMTEYIYNWRLNGYRNCQRKHLVNADLFELIENQLDTLYHMWVDIQFWHVSKEQTRVADYLANCALDGIELDVALDRYFGTGGIRK